VFKNEIKENLTKITTIINAEVHRVSTITRQSLTLYIVYFARMQP